MSNIKTPSKFQWLAATLFLGGAIVATFALLSQNTQNKAKTEQIPQTTTSDVYTETETLNEQEILAKTDQLLDILYTLYYISLDESGTPETEYELLLEMMRETLNDKKKIESLQIRVTTFSSSKDDLVPAIGQALSSGLASLAYNHATFSDYLRTIDTQNIELTEFGYQITSFGAENKGAFDTINQAALLFPYLWLDLAEGEGVTNEWAISKESRLALIADIENQFSDILEEDAINHEMTGNTNSIAFIISTYLDFLKEA